jgi:hypothetical protein
MAKLALLPDSWQTAQRDELLEIPEGQRIGAGATEKDLSLSAGRHLPKPWSDIPTAKWSFPD